MLTPESVVLLCVIGCGLAVLLLPFIAGPIRMWRTSWQAADPEFLPQDPDALPPGARRMVARLCHLGFADLGTWRIHGMPRVTGRVTLLEHPQTFDTAKVLAVWSRGRESVSLVFQTRFADGDEALTANHRVTAGFPKSPNDTVAWLPEVRDVETLYDVHEQLRDAVAAGRPVVGVGGDPVEYLREGARRVHDQWLASGYYWLDEDRGIVRPTWKGATLITWRLLWPVRPLFRAWRRHATECLLRQLDIDVTE